MKKFIFSFILTALAAIFVAAQTPRTTPRIPPRSVPFKVVTEISAADWQALAALLDKEDWKQAAALAAQHIQTLKTDNEKRQLAQLRYIYLFSLAGQILKFNSLGSATEAEKVWTEVDLAMATFIGKEFVMPPRPVTTDCGKKLNVICQVKDTPTAFRTTATNREGDAIHSFDYVQFDGPLDLREFDGKEAFIGGILRKAEYNEDRSKPWVLRLIFNKGFLNVIVRK